MLYNIDFTPYSRGLGEKCMTVTRLDGTEKPRQAAGLMYALVHV